MRKMYQSKIHTKSYEQNYEVVSPNKITILLEYKQSSNLIICTLYTVNKNINLYVTQPYFSFSFIYLNYYQPTCYYGKCQISVY